MDRPDTRPLADTPAADPAAPQPMAMPAGPRRGIDSLVVWVSVALGTVLLACGLATQALPWQAAAGMGAGLLAGRVLCRARGTGHSPQAGPGHAGAQVVAHDILTLQQAFGVLKQQVGATIQTSETAVMSMMQRLNRVHGNARDLRERIVEAVRRSQALSSDSLSRAGEHGRAVATLAEHQLRAEEQQRSNLERVGAVAEQVRQLMPLATLIADIARHTNLLAINASIEAARAGQEGAGFKVVAAEVRRLSVETSEAARQITTGIGSAAAAIDAEMAAASAHGEQSAAVQLGEIAQHIQVMSSTLSDVVPYLDQLSGHMNAGMEVVTLDIIDTLGDMQFQDINRQLLEQINDALSSLSEHFAQVYRLIDGSAPPPPMLLEELLSRWTANYVMHSQRVAHALALQPGGAATDTGQPARDDAEPNLQLATANGPRIELF